MATYLTENEDDYPAADTMVVPESFDRWGGPQSASAAVRGMARVLLNRTAWFRKRIVQLTADNILTGANEFRKPVTFTPTEINQHLFGSNVTAGNAPHPSGNRWYRVGHFKVSGGQYVDLYSGVEGYGGGVFAITHNAQWTVGAAGGAGQWTKYDNGKHATALIWRYDYLRVSGRAAADNAAWDSWPTSWDNGGTIQAEAVLAGTVTLNDAKFRTAVVRTVPIPITAFAGKGRLDDDGSVSTVGGATGEMDPAWQFSVPAGCKSGTITIHHHQDQTDVGDTFTLYKRGVGATSWTNIATKVSGTGAAPGGERVTTLRDVANVANDGDLAADTEYLITWRIGSSSGANNKIRSLAIERWEPGLRNS